MTKRDATPDTTHCTTCYAPNPETDTDGYTDCCNDTVCVVAADGSCACSPKCEKCGTIAEDGYTFDRLNRTVHPGCADVFTLPPTAEAAQKKSSKSAQKKRTAPQNTKTSESTTKRSTSSHDDCGHENTKSARAKCRRQNKK